MLTEQDLSSIIRQHSPTLRLFITSRGIPEISADDVLQKTFLSFWECRNNFDPSRGTLLSFLYGIAQRRCIDEFRSQSCRFTTQSQDHDVDKASNPNVPGRFCCEVTDSVIDNIPVEDPSHSDSDMLSRIRDLFSSLPPDISMTLSLHFFEGYTVGEIARLHCISHSSVSFRLRRGITALRALLCHG